MKNEKLYICSNAENCRKKSWCDHGKAHKCKNTSEHCYNESKCVLVKQGAKNEN